MLRLVFLVGLVILAGQAIAEDRERPPRAVTLATWYASVARAGRQPHRPKTGVGHEEYHQEVLASLQQACSGKHIKFASEVVNVYWKDGIATVYLEDPMPAVRESGRGRNLSMTFQARSVEVICTQEEATQICPKARVMVNAIVDFYDTTKNPVFSSSRRISLFDVKQKHSHVLVSSKDYRIRIAGREYQGRWAIEDGLLASQSGG